MKIQHDIREERQESLIQIFHQEFSDAGILTKYLDILDALFLPSLLVQVPPYSEGQKQWVSLVFIHIDEVLENLVMYYKSWLLPNNRYVVGQFIEFWYNA